MYHVHAHRTNGAMASYHSRVKPWENPEDWVKNKKVKYDLFTKNNYRYF